MKTPYLDQMIQNLEKYDKDGVLPNEGIDELNEYKAIKQALSLHNVSQQREFMSILTTRVLKIQSEPNGIVRETMINNLLVDINYKHN